MSSRCSCHKWFTAIIQLCAKDPAKQVEGNEGGSDVTFKYITKSINCTDNHQCLNLNTLHNDNLLHDVVFIMHCARNQLT